MLSIYPACFYQEAAGYSVIFPDLNWLATCGDTFEDAMKMAVDCLDGYLHTCQIDGDVIPSSSSMSDIDPIAVAKELVPDDPMCDGIVTMVSVDVSEYAKQHFNNSAEKISVTL